MPVLGSADIDAIQEIRELPGWSENLVVQVWDARAGISIWAHWGRIPGHPTIWEGIITCYLPGGEILTGRSFGSSALPDAASSGLATAYCVEPSRRWRVEFAGMVRRTTSHDVARGPLGDGDVEFLEVELDFVGLHPVWSAGEHMSDADWASCHLEQGGRFTGTVRHRNGEAVIDAVGFRDHSHGPRDFSMLLADTWVTAVFPSGTVMSGLGVWPLTGDPVQMGFVWDGATMHEVRGVDVPQLADPSGLPRDSQVCLMTASATQVCQVSMTHCMTYSFQEPAGMILGATDDGKVIVTEGPAEVRWRDESTTGWFEKNYRLARS